MSQIRVLIVEDEPLIAVDIEQVLTDINYEVSAIAFTVDEALHQLQNNTPDAVLLDINLDDEKDGIYIAEIIHQQYQIPFIFLTSHADRHTLDRAKKTNPAGYIVKPFDEKDVLAGLEIALYNHAQKQVLSQPKLSLTNINKKLRHPLTDREFAVLQAIYEGQTNQQMANAMFVSVNTIKTHIANIYLKLDVASRTAAIAKVRSL
jgi:DNA-binding NarL/FixJ family response regulator